MLRFTPSTNTEQAKSYYTDGLSREDYYSEGQELPGHWGGKGAELLKLRGTVEREAFVALCENIDPSTGKRLTQRQADNRRVGYDINFHCPKSVSVIHALTGDKEILEAFQRSVQATMQEMECEMKTRVRAGGRYEDRKTGNMVWGEFYHFTARPVGGIPDPHLHAHCFVFNATFDGVEGRWKAGQFGDLKRDAPYFEAAFHARLAMSLREIGYHTTRGPKGWEITGVPTRVIEKFSRRTAEIERLAEVKGVKSAKAKDQLGAATRENKRKGVTLQTLRQEWMEQLTIPEQFALDGVTAQKRSRPEYRPEVAPAQALEYALGKCFERQSAQPERTVLTHLLKRGVGSLTVEQGQLQLEAAKQRKHLVSREIGERPYCTTQEVLREERAMIRYARDGRGTCRPLNAESTLDPMLTAEQATAAKALLASTDKVMVLRGRAGTGKTRLMKEVARSVEEGGRKLLAFAPSAAASRGLLRQEGFAGADTVANLLINKDLQRSVRGQVIWIDEAGQLGSRTMKQIFDLAEKTGSRVLLTGDTRQHNAVERGDALRLLEENAGLKSSEVKLIQRQRANYREAVQAISEGRIQEGFLQLDQLGAIKQLSGQERYWQLAHDYVDTVVNGRSALVISPTHKEAHAVTRLVREHLRERELLGPMGKECQLQTLVNLNLTEAERGDAASFEEGMVVQFQWKARGNFRMGERCPVCRVDGEKVWVRKDGIDVRVPLDEAHKFQVFREEALPVAPGDLVRFTQNGYSHDRKHRVHNGSVHRIEGFTEMGDLLLENGWTIPKSYGHLAHGYVSTSYSSQGKTVDRVFIAHGQDSIPASSSEQFYVSVSRGRESVTIYTDDREELLRSVSKSGARKSAIEVGGLYSEEREALLVNRLLTHAQRFAKAQTRAFIERARRVLERSESPAGIKDESPRWESLLQKHGVYPSPEQHIRRERDHGREY